MEEQGKEFLERLLDGHNQASLHISRIPTQTKKEFKEYAEKEFCNDFGLAFKYVWDSYKGVLNFEVQEMLIRIEELESRIDLLEATQPQQKEDDGIKTLSGRVIK
jgi:hypothetical protein